MVTKARAEADFRPLSKVPIFQGLAPSTLEELERRCELKRCRADEEILGYQEGGDDVFFVISGSARVIIYSAAGKAVGFRELKAGDVFGEYAAIDGESRSASIEADADCVVLVMPSAEFRAILLREPTVAFRLLEHFTRQLRVLTKRVYEFSTLAVNHRIQAELLRLALKSKPSEANGGSSVRLSPAPKHAELAARVSTHREAITRHLSHLTKLGVIERQGRALVIKDLTRLQDMVREATGE